MSAWKRGRGRTERHGWGPGALARWIGRQRREARRPTGRDLSIAYSDVTRLLSELADAEDAYEVAVKFYERAPLACGELFEQARAAYIAADERRDVLRAAYRAAMDTERRATTTPAPTAPPPALRAGRSA